MERGRAESWDAAVLLAGQAPEAREVTISMLDRSASGLGRTVLAPPFPIPAALQVIRFAERTPMAEAVARLDRALGL